MASSAVIEARQALGKQLRALREAAGLTQQQMAELLGYSRPHIAGAEKGEGCALLFWQGCDKVLNTRGALIDGFNEVERLRQREAENAAVAARDERVARIQGLGISVYDTEGVSDLSGFAGRSHKFIAAHIGSRAVERIITNASVTNYGPSQWMEYCRTEVGHSSGRCNLYLWPFGVAIFHLVEDLDMTSVSRLAVWRVRSYDENLAWATTRLRQLSGDESLGASYVLSLYWIDNHGWPSDKLDTALRVMCVPKVLLQREPGQTQSEQERAELIERRLLGNGFDHVEMKPFGLSGVSVGYASWSGVVYHPESPDQSLTEPDLVDFELAVQAIWVYCEHITQQVENGFDPITPDQYGWRFLRGIKSRLINPRPQETGQHRDMRSSIIETSGLAGHLDQATEALYQISGK